jgi:hypothetical protein
MNERSFLIFVNGLPGPLQVACEADLCKQYYEAMNRWRRPETVTFYESSPTPGVARVLGVFRLESLLAVIEQPMPEKPEEKPAEKQPGRLIA